MISISKIFLVACSITACTHPETNPDASGVAGMANPASVHCYKVGGTLRIESAPEGQYGICVLPDGSEIEEWTLFRRDNPAPKGAALQNSPPAAWSSFRTFRKMTSAGINRLV